MEQNQPPFTPHDRNLIRSKPQPHGSAGNVQTIMNGKPTTLVPSGAILLSVHSGPKGTLA